MTKLKMKTVLHSYSVFVNNDITCTYNSFKNYVLSDVFKNFNS